MTEFKKEHQVFFGIGLFFLLGFYFMRHVTPQSARELIKKHEGLRLNVYLDSAGYKTIGYGHKLLPSENYTTITLQKAEELLDADMKRIGDGIKKNILRPTTDNQYAAFLSLAFNIGASAFNSSTLLKKFNAGDIAGAANEFPRWNKATVNGQKVEIKGLTNRRNDEKKVFLS